MGLRENAAAIACLTPIAAAAGGAAADGAEGAGEAGTGAGMLPPPLIVGCIHLLFNPKRGDHKLGQLRVFMERIEAHRAAGAYTRPAFSSTWAVADLE